MEKTKRFREKIAPIYVFSIIFAVCIVTIPFWIIIFLQPGNIVFLPMVLVWSVVVLLMAYFVWLPRLSTIILLSDTMLVPNRAYKNQDDLRTEVRIKNGRLVIAYSDILDVKVEEKTIYIEYVGLSSQVIIEPANTDKFLLILREKLKQVNIDIPITIMPKEVIDDGLLVFRTNNKPLAVVGLVIWGLLQIPGIWKLSNGETVAGIILLVVLNVMMFLFMLTILVLYKHTIILSKEGIVEIKTLGGVNLGKRTISYNDITEIKYTKWRVDITTESGGLEQFVLSKKEKFYFELEKKVYEVKGESFRFK